MSIFEWWQYWILDYLQFPVPVSHYPLSVLSEPVPGPLALVKTWWPHWNVTQATSGDRDLVLPLHRQSIAGSLVIHLQISSVQLELVNFGPSGAWHKAGLFLIITIMFHEDCDSLWNHIITCLWLLYILFGEKWKPFELVFILQLLLHLISWRVLTSLLI